MIAIDESFKEEVVMPGINGKMNEIQAALGLAVLDYVADERNKRKLLVETYRRCLSAVPGITLAQAALTLSAALDLVVYLTPYYPNNRAPGDTPLFVAASLGYYAAWMIYLTTSRRVKAFRSNPRP